MKLSYVCHGTSSRNVRKLLKSQQDVQKSICLSMLDFGLVWHFSIPFDRINKRLPLGHVT